MNTPVTLALALATALAFTAAPAAAGPKGCPPGLAKKTPACVPPGQAKKGVTAEEWATRDRSDDDDDRYDVGDRVDRDRYVILSEGDRVIFDGEEYVVVDTDNGTVLRRGDDWYRLPRYDDGTEYVRIGDSILRVNRDTQQVIEFMRLADLILS